MNRGFLVFLFVISVGIIQAQTDILKIPAFNGILTDINGKPVKRAHVWVKNERNYALTDNKGHFGLSNVILTDTLHISIKHRQFKIPIDGRRSLRIVLTDTSQPQSEEDQQLVDLGFGFVSRREHTGVSNYISGDDLRRSGQQDVLSALQGRVAGLNISGTVGMGSMKQEVNIRGNRTIMGSSVPVFLIDGIVVSSFEGLNLNDIDYVEIMKDATIFGSNGANGAIIVHTKSARKQ
ncbi:MAG: TonB-dependent receptor plug domain-containing protein [Prevotella sp.]|nr:TonB-dependent receptor plug domain-containing protein [Prevotella sp.]